LLHYYYLCCRVIKFVFLESNQELVVEALVIRQLLKSLKVEEGGDVIKLVVGHCWSEEPLVDSVIETSVKRQRPVSRSGTEFIAALPNLVLFVHDP